MNAWAYLSFRTVLIHMYASLRHKIYVFSTRKQMNDCIVDQRSK